MSDTVKISKDAEELSMLIDMLNCGTNPDSQDEEIAELLAVAALVKKVGVPVPPPQNIVDETVDKIIAAMPHCQPKRSRAWLYSSTLGIAASVLLVIGLNLLPSWTQQLPPIAPPTAGVRQNISPETPITSQTTPHDASSDKQSSRVSQVIVAPYEPAQPAASSNQTAATTEIALHKPVSDQPAPPNLSPTTPPTAVAQMPAEGVAKSSKRFSASPPPKPKSPSSSLPVLSLPGQTPDSIISDKENGTIRQIFHAGTPEEIVITQRALTQENSTAKAIPDTKEKTPGLLHKVTVKLHGQEVTIEGRQTEHDLQKIAASLEL